LNLRTNFDVSYLARDQGAKIETSTKAKKHASSTITLRLLVIRRNSGKLNRMNTNKGKHYSNLNEDITIFAVEQIPYNKRN
jgi:hypothetical protein